MENENGHLFLSKIKRGLADFKNTFLELYATASSSRFFPNSYPKGAHWTFEDIFGKMSQPKKASAHTITF
jgi:hypothetical protein